MAQIGVIGNRPVLVFTCHPTDRPSGAAAARAPRHRSVVGDSVTGRWDITRARPFTAEPALFAAPLVQQRNGEWAFVGCQNLESGANRQDKVQAAAADAG